MVRGLVCGSSGEPPMATRVSDGGKRVRMGKDRVRVGMSWLGRPRGKPCPKTSGGSGQTALTRWNMQKGKSIRLPNWFGQE